MRSVPLKHLVNINQRVLPESTSPDYEFGYVDISSVGRGTLVAGPQRMTFEQAPSRARRLIRDGDVLVSTVRTYLRAVWHPRPVAPDLVASTGFAVLTPRTDVDARFLGWLAESDAFIDQVVARSTGVSYPAIAPSDLGEINVLVPRRVEQRAIADFLDAETARIDALLSLRDLQARLLEDRWIATVNKMLWAESTREGQTRLKHLCGMPTSGNRDHASFTYTEGGIPCLRGLNVRRGWIKRAELLRISARDHARHLATKLDAGDVVVVRSGLAGSAAVVPPDLDGSNCVDLVVIRRSDAVLPRYLELVLNSQESQEDVRRRSTGALLSHFNAIDAADVLVPTRSISEQDQLVAILDRAEAETSRVASTVARQITLLRERRQALITAAVTGEIDVSTASGRGAPP